MNARGCGRSVTEYEIKGMIFEVKRPKEILLSS